MKLKNPWLLPLLIIFLAGLFLRIYRLDELLGFFYDPGRDALVIHKIINDHKLTLIGPTSGVEGIFIGPFYYYLQVPAYIVSGGDPSASATWLGFINALAIILIFFIGKKLFSASAGLIAAALFAFSWDAVNFSRWFSNPSTIPFFVGLILLSIVNLKLTKRGIWLVIASLGIGLSLQLEAAAAIWFIPALLISLFVLKIKPKLKWTLISLGVFFLLALPQIIFDLKHDFLMTKAFYNFLIAEKSFKLSLAQTIQTRLDLYLSTYKNALGLSFIHTLLVLTISLLSIIAVRRFGGENLKHSFWGVYLLLIWIFSTLVGLIFYTGNNGYVWSYYLSGTIPALYLIIGFVASLWLKKFYLIPFVFLFLILCFNNNLNTLKGYLGSGIGPNTINYQVQKQAIDYIYKDALDQNFNVDVYVPPVIPVNYEYLFAWLGESKYKKLPEKENVPLLYTIEEVDNPHPERLKRFIDRQNSFSKVINIATFGGITVEKRLRTIL